MPTRKQRLLALLATARAANLPTVVTHVMVALLVSNYGPGVASSFGIGFSLRDTLSDDYFIVAGPYIIFLALLLYLGGCLLGDGVDAAFDCEHRPDRPIPRGILSARVVSVAGYSMIGLAWFLGATGPLFIILLHFDVSFADVLEAIRTGAILSAFNPIQILTSTILALAILTYAKYHKSMGAFAPILMAICRALLVIWVAGPWVDSFSRSSLSGMFSFPVLSYAACTFLYTLSLSLVARNESHPNAKLPGWPVKLLFILPPLVLSWLLFLPSFIAAGIANLPATFLEPTVTHIALAFFTLLYLAWAIHALTRLKRSIPAFVSAALAGFCLMDACFAALIGWQIALVCLGLFLLALLLQRIAPAT